MEIATLLATPAGRILRIVFGAVLILIGIFILPKPGGYVIEAVGLIPIITGVMNISLIAPLLGAPLKGSELRDYQQD